MKQESEGDRAIFALSGGCQQAGDKADAGSPDIRYRIARTHSCLHCSQRQWVGGAIAALDPETVYDRATDPIIHCIK